MNTKPFSLSLADRNRHRIQALQALELDDGEVSAVSGGSDCSCVVDRTGGSGCIQTIVLTPNGDGYIACAGPGK